MERRRLTGPSLHLPPFSKPSGQGDPATATLVPTEQALPPAAALSPLEAAALGAKLQKVVELTVKGVEIWFVLGAAEADEGDLIAAQRTDRRSTGHLKAARIASLKKGSKVSCCCIFVFDLLPHSFWVLRGVVICAQSVHAYFLGP